MLAGLEIRPLLGMEDLGDALVIDVLPLEAVQIEGEQLPHEVPQRPSQLPPRVLAGRREHDREFLVFYVLYLVRRGGFKQRVRAPQEFTGGHRQVVSADADRVAPLSAVLLEEGSTRPIANRAREQEGRAVPV